MATRILTGVVYVGLPMAVWAQSGDVALPRVGTILAGDGSLRPVYGVAGSFAVGQASATGVLGAACSQGLCVAMTESGLLVRGGEGEPGGAGWEPAAGHGPAPHGARGSAVIGLDGGSAWVYFSDTGAFAHWQDGVLMPLDWRVDGEVLSIAPDARIAVRRDGGVWIVRPEGGVLDALPEAAGAVLLLDDATVFAAGGEIVIQRADRSQRRFALGGIERITPMSDGWVQVTAGGSVYALRIVAGREALYVIPAGGPPPALPQGRRR